MKVDLHHLHDFYLPICILPPNTVESIQFHLFTDASELAYAAVLYARFVDSMGFVAVNVVAGKKQSRAYKNFHFHDLSYVQLTWEPNYSQKFVIFFNSPVIPTLKPLPGLIQRSFYNSLRSCRELGLPLSRTECPRFNRFFRNHNGVMSHPRVTQLIVHLVERPWRVSNNQDFGGMDHFGCRNLKTNGLR